MLHSFRALDGDTANIQILSLVTGPSVEPITVAEAKEHLRLEVTVDDAYVTALIVAAREYVERIAWRALITQTWKATMDSFPFDGVIVLPKGNLLSVTSVQYLDANAVLTTLPTTEYEVDTFSVPGRVLLAYQKSWPDTVMRWNTVQVTFVAGFGPAASDVPSAIKHVLKLLVSQMYEHRTPEVTGTIVSKVQFAVESLLAPYRLMRFA